MPDEKYTRCPDCKTIFRVTPEQLALRAGQVRCGHCHVVFDGVAQLVLIPEVPQPRQSTEEFYDEALHGPPTMTLRTPRSAPSPAPAAAKEAPPAPVNYGERFAPPSRRRAVALLHAVGVPFLLLALVIQGIVHFRDLVAARSPAAKPVLTRICAWFGCTIRPVRDINGLGIESSDLQVDAAHRGLLILSATLRNRSTLPLAYPYLELTLTDARDQTVARRALQPAEYAGGTADLTNGIPANGEIPLRLFIDASATNQAGYRLYLFYP